MSRIKGIAAVAPAFTGIIESGSLGQLLPSGVAAFETHAPESCPPLLPGEEQYVANAVPTRVHEFRAGRACARAALRQLGIEGFAVRRGTNREPLWPPGIVGSITHTSGYVAAVAGRASLMRAVGIDAERRACIERPLWNEIATQSELEWLAGLADPAAAISASVLFSAKEAFFKCQFPLAGEWLEFRDVRIEPDASSGFEVVPCRPLRLQRCAQRPWRGRFRVGERHVTTAICLT